MARPSDTDRALGEKLNVQLREGVAPPSDRKIGKYLISRMLGSGGMGDVYLAMDPDLGREVAIKVINLPLTTPEFRRTFIERFRLEARAAARVTHQNVVTIYEFSEAEGKHLLVMEYIRGRTLKELIVGEKALPPEQVVRLAIDIVDGLTAIHSAGMIHRDVKPMNLMLTSTGRVKILDFGLVRDAMQPSDLTQMGFVAGSPSYMAPEQANLVAGKIDARSDLYALGVVLFQLLTGRLPFIGNDAREILEKHCQAAIPPITSPHGPVPSGLIDIVRKAMSKKPDERYATASEMRSALGYVRGSMKASISGLSKTLPASGVSSSGMPRKITPVGITPRVRAVSQPVPVAAKATPEHHPRSPKRPPPIPAAALRPRRPSVPPVSATEVPAKVLTMSWPWKILVFISAIGCAVLTWMHVTGRAPWSARASTVQEERTGSTAAASAPDAAVPIVVPTADDGCKAYEEMKLGLAIEILNPLDVGTLDARQLFCRCASEHSLGHADERKDCQLYLKHPGRDRGKARQVELWLSKPGTQ